MGKEFKPGDLAVIIGAHSMFDMVGKCVELVMPVAPGDLVTVEGQKFRNLTSGAAWVIQGDGLKSPTRSGKIIHGALSLAAERHLMPLRGDAAPSIDRAATAPHQRAHA